MKPSSILYTSLAACLATLTTAAPIGQPQKRQMGLSFLSTGVVSASSVAAALAAGATAATEAVKAEPTATDAASAVATAAESATKKVKKQKASETATATSVAAEPTATAAAAAAPAAPANIDVVVLNLAFTLEQLEGKFYEEALKKFSLTDMVNAGLNEMQANVILEEIQGIQRNEAVHATVLSGAIKALGAEPFNGCQFNFGATLDDPLTFLAVARTLEAVGVAAYAGAASLISDPALLTAAASILTLEARHQSLLNTFNSGTFAPQSFDIALAPEQILALAGGFLSNCQASDLGLTSNLPLSITDKASKSTRFQVGSDLAFSSSEDFAVESHFCQMFVGGAPDAVVFEAQSCVVPEGIEGPVAIFLTKSSTPLASNLQIQNKADIAFGPGFIFVDGVASKLSTLFQVQNVHDSIASANLGGYHVNRRKGNHGNAKNDNNNYDQAIKAVVQTRTGVNETTEAIKGHNAIKSESSAPSSGAYNYRRNYRKPEKRGNGDVREVGWSMVRRA